MLSATEDISLILLIQRNLVILIKLKEGDGENLRMHLCRGRVGKRSKHKRRRKEDQTTGKKRERLLTDFGKKRKEKLRTNRSTSKNCRRGSPSGGHNSESLIFSSLERGEREGKGVSVESPTKGRGEDFTVLESPGGCSKIFSHFEFVTVRFFTEEGD